MKFEKSLHCCKKERIQRKAKNKHTRGEQETAVFLSVAINISRTIPTGNVNGSGEISKINVTSLDDTTTTGVSF